MNSDIIPVYGNGRNVRDWLHVSDHIDGILKIAKARKLGQTYCIGGFGEISNIELVQEICIVMDQIFPKNYPHEKLIKFVSDRPGHDKRYAMNSKKIQTELKWKPKYNLKSGIKETVNWYLKNLKWVAKVQKSSGYDGSRLGKL